MKDKFKNLFSFSLRILLSVGCLWYLTKIVDIEQTWSVLKSANISLILSGAAIFYVIVGLALYRWFIFIRALELKAHASTVVRYYFIGLFGNLFLPSAIGGDLLKIIGLCKDSSQKPRVVASILLDRLSGFASIAIVAVISYFLGYQYIEDKTLSIPIALMGGGVLVLGGILFNQKIYAFFTKVFLKFPRIEKALMSMHYDIMLLGDRKMEGVKAIILSCGFQILLAVSYFLVAKALHQDIALIYFLIFVPIICVASSVPSIGGLGVREAGAAYLFTKIGVDSGIAVSLSLMNFFFVVIVGVIGGLVYVVTVPPRRV